MKQFQNNPQEGTRFGGESLPEDSSSGCPSESGVGRTCDSREMVVGNQATSSNNATGRTNEIRNQQPAEEEPARRRSTLRKERTCPNCGKIVNSSNLARHRRSKTCTSVSTGNVTLNVEVNRTSPKVSCANCGASVLASNIARHRKSKKCMSSSTNDVRPNAEVNRNPVNHSSPKSTCANCGAVVHSSNLARHRRSKTCMFYQPRSRTVQNAAAQHPVVDESVPGPSNMSPTVQPPVIDESVPGPSNIPPTVQPPVIDESVPGPSNMATTVQPPLIDESVPGPSNENMKINVKCPVCHKLVNKYKIKQHQKTQICIDDAKSLKHDLRKLNIKPAPKAKMCWACEKNVELSNWSRHSCSLAHKNHERTKEKIVPSESTKERIKDLKAPRLPATQIDLTKLVAKYPKRTIQRPVIKRNTEDDDIITEAVTRKPTHPMNPSKFRIVKNTVDSMSDFDTSQLDKYADYVTDDQFNNLMSDLSLLGTPTENSSDSEVSFGAPIFNSEEFEEAMSGLEDKLSNLFSTPVRKEHPESLEIRRILGPPPFSSDLESDFELSDDDSDEIEESVVEIDPTHTDDEQDYQLHIPSSPVYGSPPHFPDSPSYSLLSPPYTSNKTDMFSDESGDYDIMKYLESSDEIINSAEMEEAVMDFDLSLLDDNCSSSTELVTVPEEHEDKNTSSHESEIETRSSDETQDETETSDEEAPEDSRPQTPLSFIREKETAFKNRLKTFIIENVQNIKDPLVFFARNKEISTKTIQNELESENVKVNLLFLAEFKKNTVKETEISHIKNFKTKNEILYPTSSVSDYYDTASRKLISEMENFQENGSQWMLSRILSLEIRINRYRPFFGSSYIELPIPIQSKKAVINVQNNDEKCFLWAILSALHPAESHSNRLSKYKPFEHELDAALEGIQFPVKLSDVAKFEKRSGISVNVYQYNDCYDVSPLRVTDNEMKQHVDLLYVKEKGRTHYCYIKNLAKLVHSQITKKCSKIWLCKRCLVYFGREDLLQRHTEDCKTHSAVRINLPHPKERIRFKDFKCSMKIPFVVYADFESLLAPIQTCKPPSFQLEKGENGEVTYNENAPSSYTHPYQKHEAASFSYYVASTMTDFDPFTYFGTDAPMMFVQKMLELSKQMKSLYKNKIPMLPLTQTEQLMYDNASTCHVCGKALKGDSVRDHDHLTGRFRGAAHKKCNLDFQVPKFIPVFIHNLAGYDTHLFIKMFGLNGETINVIPNNEERYISYTVRTKDGVDLRFLDSFKFLNASLDKLVSNLSENQFKHTSKYFSGRKLELMMKKGTYPYEYMDRLEKYMETSLPQKSEFYSTLNKAHITDKDYQHACDVWKEFNIRNMKEYTLLYNKTDVLLLADVMESFREVCLETYKLDPAWHYTTPGLAWNAMLKITGIELTPLTDYDMILMVEKGIRGGLSQCSHRYSKANNPYMKNYDSKQPNNYLIYVDANNLYGWAMGQNMPYGDFEWCSTDIDVTTIPDDADTGYFLEVDLEYPKELHDLHSDLPLAPEHRTPPGSKEPKLLATLYDKEKYVIHYRNLKQCLEMGLKLKKIHRVISFSQKAWIKPYIDLNTSLRTKAKNDFEKDFFKLMNNSPFGKMMENIRNRVDIRLATTEKQVDKWVAKPNFKDRTIFCENLAAIHMTRTNLLFNKPIYVGASILDISKTLIYDFHYNVIKEKYGEDAELQYTDTDSLTYAIKTHDFYEDMKGMIDYFDTSDYPENNKYNMPRLNKKVLGKFKDELNGKIMEEFVGLRSKMYANKIDSGEVTKKSKGVRKSVVQGEITFEDYKDCLFQKNEHYRSMNQIRSFTHDLYTVEYHKSVLSWKDDKRYILPDGIETLPWGHYSI